MRALPVLMLALLVALVGVTPRAWPHDARVGGIEVADAWARASAGPAKTGAVYLTLVNHGSTPDRLLAVSCPRARKAMLHETTMEAGVMKMRPAGSVEIAPGATLRLAPGGLHVMLMGLSAPLEEGASFPLTLRFERAGEVTVEVAVGPPGAMQPAD